MELSKQQEKQLKDTVRTLNFNTTDIREMFYANTVQFEEQRIQARREALTIKLNNNPKSWDVKSIEQSITMCNKKLAKRYSNSLVWMSEAKTAFDAKINNVAKKLVGFGLAERMVIENISFDINGELSFYIEGYSRKDDSFLGRAYARAIIVNGTEKAMHMRWIVTKKA